MQPFRLKTRNHALPVTAGIQTEKAVVEDP
jgi:hypothetical protein